MFTKPTLLLLGLSLLSAVKAQEFDNNDVPQQCRSVCQAMVDAARTCDQNFDGDRQEVDCICNTENASTALPECAACIRQFDSDDDDDDDDDENDVDEVVRSCGFSSTTFTGATASASSTGSDSGAITSSASRSLITSTFVTTSTDFDDDPDDQDETRTLTRTTVFAADSTPTSDAGGSASSAGQSGTSVVGGAVESATSGAGDSANSATSAAGDSATSDSGAAATGLPMLGAGAGAILAVVGLL